MQYANGKLTINTWTNGLSPFGSDEILEKKRTGEAGKSREDALL